MHLVSRALAWARVMLIGPPEYSRAACGTTPRSTPSARVPRPSPEMWAPFLASARRRRTSPSRPRPDLPAITADDISTTLVGAYLLLPEVRQRVRGAVRLAEEACR